MALVAQLSADHLVLYEARARTDRWPFVDRKAVRTSFAHVRYAPC